MTVASYYGDPLGSGGMPWRSPTARVAQLHRLRRSAEPRSARRATLRRLPTRPRAVDRFGRSAHRRRLGRPGTLAGTARTSAHAALPAASHEVRALDCA